MTAPVLIILLLAIFVIPILLGYKKGLIQMLYSLGSILISIVLCFLLHPFVQSFLMNGTHLYEHVYHRLDKVLEQKKVGEAPNPEKEMPKLIQKLLDKHNKPEQYKKYGITNTREYMVEILTRMLIKVISFLVTFLIVFVILKVLLYLLNAVALLPVVHFFNHLGGALVGAVEGLLLVWLFFLILTVLGSTPFASGILDTIGKNPVLSSLYNTNLFAVYLLKQMFLGGGGVSHNLLR